MSSSSSTIPEETGMEQSSCQSDEYTRFSSACFHHEQSSRMDDGNTPRVVRQYTELDLTSIGNAKARSTSKFGSLGMSTTKLDQSVVQYGHQHKATELLLPTTIEAMNPGSGTESANRNEVDPGSGECDQSRGAQDLQIDAAVHAPTTNAKTKVITTDGMKELSPMPITDPIFIRHGAYAERMLYSTNDSEVDATFSSYRRRRNTKRFFVVGRVIMVLWADRAGETSSLITSLGSGEQSSQNAERVYANVRRFVVVREGETYCNALPITTYGGRGVAKFGIKKSEHAIVYSDNFAPPPHRDEYPSRSEEGMRPQAIKIVTDSREDKLDSMARIDFGKVHTIHHNVKVKSYGSVHKKFIDHLLGMYYDVCSGHQSAANKRSIDLTAALQSQVPARPQPAVSGNPDATMLRSLSAQGLSIGSLVPVSDQAKEEYSEDSTGRVRGSFSTPEMRALPPHERVKRPAA